MEKIEIINLYNKDIVVNIKISKKKSRRIAIVGGQLYMTLTEGYKVKELEKTLSRILSKKKIDSFYSSLYITDQYIDILGERRKLVNQSKGQIVTNEKDFKIINEKDLSKKLKQLTYDIIKSRVAHYSRIMNIPVEYNVKITLMRSSVGKNYYKKHLLTFDKKLIHYSLEIIDSVVVHELTHYFVQNHSKDFYNILLKYMPNYRMLRQKLMKGVRK